LATGFLFESSLAGAAAFLDSFAGVVATFFAFSVRAGFPGFAVERVAAGGVFLRGAGDVAVAFPADFTGEAEGFAFPPHAASGIAHSNSTVVNRRVFTGPE
jgi:hypothetical protein